MANADFPVPKEVPGKRITDPQHVFSLKQHLNKLCGRGVHKFPGSQPVSFTQDSLKLLESEDFWVCEKSDGLRVIALIFLKNTTRGPVQEFYFVDRKDEFYMLENIMFPHFQNPNWLLSDTILDGELVIDVDPKTGRHQLRLLTFDCLVLDGSSLMMRPLTDRYSRLKDCVIAPLKKMIQARPRFGSNMPFDVQLKDMEPAHGIEKVLQDLPRLTHGNDGLIFTSATAPYRIGTDKNILKWKPPFQNSIDFRLELRFPPAADSPNETDFYAKPIFALMMNCGNDPEKYFDTLQMSDEEWLDRKQRREQLDNRVVEVVWDPTIQTWKIIRFRDDKNKGNYKDVVNSIIYSIHNGVEAAELSKQSGRIHKAWKTRSRAFNSIPPSNKLPAYSNRSAPHSRPSPPYISQPVACASKTQSYSSKSHPYSQQSSNGSNARPAHQWRQPDRNYSENWRQRPV